MCESPGRLEWDEAKRRENRRKHDVDFVEAAKLVWDAALSIGHERGGERRTLTYAPIGDRLYALVWTPRGPAVRVISLRKANSREVDKYEKAQAAHAGRKQTD